MIEKPSLDILEAVFLKKRCLNDKNNLLKQ
jgi:hypothetical protein